MGMGDSGNGLGVVGCVRDTRTKSLISGVTTGGYWSGHRESCNGHWKI